MCCLQAERATSSVVLVEQTESQPPVGIGFRKRQVAIQSGHMQKLDSDLHNFLHVFPSGNFI